MSARKKTPAQVLREIAESDPVGHGQRLARAYGAGPEPSVQVPVSLIERLREALTKLPASGENADIYSDLGTLLSQPTPTAEPPRIEDMAPRTTENPEGWPYSVAPDGAERCGVAFLGYEKGDGSCEYLPGHPGRHWSTQWGSWSL